MVEIRLTNSMTRKKETLVPIRPGQVSMYVCGPTVYDRAHLGNARPVVVFDVLFRLLRHVYGEDAVTYVRNFTDVDDRINETAQKRKAAGATGTLEDLIRERSDETIRWYHDDMDAVGALRPTHEPRATEYIPQMVAMIEDLIAKGFAYENEGHVLFRVRRYAEYGQLSGRSVEDMIAGARVEVAPYKEDPMDFVLWKPSDDDLPGWPSPWGRGRPGWHIECSAMSYALLGDSFDIHGGGNDLLFPHHENEIAQSCCAHPEGSFASIWLHNEMLQVEGKKMSKSLGNFFTVRDLLDKGVPGWNGVPGDVIRYVFLLTHYRKPMDWRQATAITAKQRLDIWSSEVQSNRELEREFKQDRDEFVRNYVDPTVVEALADDLNTSNALTTLIAAGKKLEGLSRVQFTDDEVETIQRQLVAGCYLIGIDLYHYANAISRGSFNLSDFASKLTALRETAMQTKDFSAVDALKSSLLAAGAEVRMTKAGVEVIPGPNFDPAKLEPLK